MRRIFVSLLLLSLFFMGYAHEPEFSTAGFFRLPDTGRDVYSMNPAWRFYKGSAVGAEAKEFNDKAWQVVSLPNGIEYLPTEARDRKSTRLNSSHPTTSRMPSSA